MFQSSLFDSWGIEPRSRGDEVEEVGSDVDMSIFDDIEEVEEYEGFAPASGKVKLLPVVPLKPKPKPIKQIPCIAPTYPCSILSNLSVLQDITCYSPITNHSLIEFDSQGCLFIAANSSGVIEAYDFDQMSTGFNPILTINSPVSSLECIKWNPDNENQILVSSRLSSSIFLQDLSRSNGRVVGEYTSSTPGIFDIAVLPESSGKKLASGGHRGVVQLWDTRTGKSKGFSQPSRHSLSRYDDQTTVRSVRFSADGQTLLAVHESGIVQLWDIRYSPTSLDRFSVLSGSSESGIGSNRVNNAVACAEIDSSGQLYVQTRDASIYSVHIESRTSTRVSSAPDGAGFLPKRKLSFPKHPSGMCGYWTEFSFHVGLETDFPKLPQVSFDKEQWIPMSYSGTMAPFSIHPTLPYAVLGTDRGLRLIGTPDSI